MLNEFREILELTDKIEDLAGSTTDIELYQRIKYDLNHLRRMIKGELSALETRLMKEYKCIHQSEVEPAA